MFKFSPIADNVVQGQRHVVHQQHGIEQNGERPCLRGVHWPYSVCTKSDGHPLGEAGRTTPCDKPPVPRASWLLVLLVRPVVSI